MDVEDKPKILVLGGTNFMGKTLIKWFHQNAPFYEIYTINRGKVYWNNEAKRDNPNVNYYYGDRKQRRDVTKLIGYVGEKAGISTIHPWKAVIDFTSYCWRDLQSSIKALKNKTQLYIFISSDSLYNCNSHTKGQCIEQQKFNLQENYQVLKGKKKTDKYGYDKLKCQLYLQRTKYVPYICLRLPDVIGPFDNTDRYWCSLTWIQRNSSYKIELSEKDQELPLSFVFSQDVGKLIGQVVTSSDEYKKYESYNLAFEETPTFKQFITLLASTVNFKQSLNFKNTKKNSSGFYPSTEYMNLNIEKAVKDLGWKPTKLQQSMKKTSDFFLKRGSEFDTQRREMERQFRRKVIDQD